MDRRSLIILIMVAVLAALLYFFYVREPRFEPIPANSTVLAIGDSLTYGKGAARDQSYPAVLQTLIPNKVINAGVNGETSAMGMERLPELLTKYKPSLVIICLGGNDLIRKTPNEVISRNLNQMVYMARQSGAQVMLIGVPAAKFSMEIPDFYYEIAGFYKIPLEAKLLKSLLRDRESKSDMVHLNSEGYKKMAEGIAKFLKSRGAITQ